VARHIELVVEGTRGTFALIEDWAPRTTAILWDVLPLEDQLLRHAKQSGDAAFVVLEDPKFQDLPSQNELSVTSIYKGYMVANLHPERSSVELLISYGLSEYRWPDGRRYVTPVAEIEGDGSEFFEMLRSTWTQGAKKMSFRRKD
jgi:Protein of unknown function (DUF3830)